MTEESVERSIGRIEGQLNGICREIGEIKTLLKCKDQDCETCKKGIDSEIDALKKTHIGEDAVKTWWKSELAILSFIITSFVAGMALIDFLFRFHLIGGS